MNAPFLSLCDAAWREAWATAGFKSQQSPSLLAGVWTRSTARASAAFVRGCRALASGRAGRLGSRPPSARFSPRPAASTTAMAQRAFPNPYADHNKSLAEGYFDSAGRVSLGSASASIPRELHHYVRKA